MDWRANTTSVYLHPGSSQVSESFATFNGRMKMFFPLETVYVLNNELCYSKIVISCETLYLFLAKVESK